LGPFWIPYTPSKTAHIFNNPPPTFPIHSCCFPLALSWVFGASLCPFDVGWNVGFCWGRWLRLVLLWIVANRYKSCCCDIVAELLMWLMVVVAGLLRYWLLGLLRDVLEPPLSFQDLQPHVRSWSWWVWCRSVLLTLIYSGFKLVVNMTSSTHKESSCWSRKVVARCPEYD
jgi:hypothetical protein